jgi:ppGpp synthetase/RelA/SpoT-type nucleotidyltranferase
MIRSFPAGTVLSALNPGMALPAMAACVSDVFLTENLQRQSRHIGFEFMRLRDIRYQTAGPDSGNGEISQEAVTGRLDSLFHSLLSRGVSEEAIADEAKLAEATLREVRTLYNKDHFFSKPMHAFYRAFTILSPEYDLFGEELFQNLYHYRRRRDEDERKFMEKFDPYAQELRGIIGDISQGYSFRHFEIELRIKRDLLAKYRKRVEDEGWTNMTDNFYDLIGLRIIVGSQAGVDAAVALVEGAMKLHEAVARSGEGCPHFFRVDNIETKDNERGYRAKHINVTRTCNGKKKTYAIAEIQVMSRGIKEWGDIQRLLVYKDDAIPESLKTELSLHCRKAADFIVEAETRPVLDKYPEFDITALNRIPDEKLMNDVYDRVADLQKLMEDYQERSLSLPEPEPHPPSLPPPDVDP